MTDFLGGQMLRWLLWPYRTGGKASLKGMSVGARTLGKTIGRIAGAELLQDLGEFLAAFEGMYEGFKERAERVTELLRDRATGFVVVTAPEGRSLEEATHFVERLIPAGMDLVSIVVNRWAKAPAARAPEEVRARLASGTPRERAVSAALENAERLAAVERRGHAAIEPFQRGHPDVPLTLVPQLAGDVHDVAGLDRLIEHLA
jgi:anion-transporting  ArsA/GET3 family ATPase